ncbi:MAG: hypothetical protein AABY22_14945 [Nanoarchaeota archaeon]
MKCSKCENEIGIKLASKVEARGCDVLTNMTTILTIKCSKCGYVSQIPLSSNSMLSVKKSKKN